MDRAYIEVGKCVDVKRAYINRRRCVSMERRDDNTGKRTVNMDRRSCFNDFMLRNTHSLRQRVGDGRLGTHGGRLGTHGRGFCQLSLRDSRAWNGKGI